MREREIFERELFFVMKPGTAFAVMPLLPYTSIQGKSSTGVLMDVKGILSPGEEVGINDEAPSR